MWKWWLQGPEWWFDLWEWWFEGRKSTCRRGKFIDVFGFNSAIRGLNPTGGRELRGRWGLFGPAKTETTLFTMEAVLSAAGTVSAVLLQEENYFLTVLFLAKTSPVGL
ncbi:MAG: hypothetical protein OXU94_04610 [Gammaproteobacteria bacterium]|nr:hypothetical protein [Gammaproteobacteria bacterium]